MPDDDLLEAVGGMLLRLAGLFRLIFKRIRRR